jgi:hypothetical protein
MSVRGIVRERGDRSGALQAAALSWAERGRLRWLVGASVAEALAALGRDGQGAEAWEGWLARLERLVEQAAGLGWGVPASVEPRRTLVARGKLAGSRRGVSRRPGNGYDARQGRLDGETYVVVFFASASARGAWVTLAIGIDPTGCKHVLGLWPGSTADAAVSGAALEALAERGLAPRPALLAVTDGSGAADEALRRQWGKSVLIAHCRERVRQEVVAHLPEKDRPAVTAALRRAWSLPVPDAGRALRDLAERLRHAHPGAAARLERSLESTLTVARLELPERLRSHLEIAGPVRVVTEEACRAGGPGSSGVAAVAAGLPAVVGRMRRLIGHEALPRLAQKLDVAGTDR